MKHKSNLIVGLFGIGFCLVEGIYFGGGWWMFALAILTGFNIGFWADAWTAERMKVRNER